MSRQITQELADKIRQKLCGSEEPKTTSGHDVYAIRHAGKVVGKISLRRSTKEVGHDYIPGDINVSMHFAKEIGICHKDLSDYIACLRDKGLVQSEQEATPLPKAAKYAWDRDWVALQEAESRSLDSDLSGAPAKPPSTQ